MNHVNIEEFGKKIIGNYKFVESIAYKNYIFCIPDNYDHIIRIDTNKKITDKKAWVNFGKPLDCKNQTNKFKTAILTEKGIYCIPDNNNYIIRINVDEHESSVNAWVRVGKSLFPHKRYHNESSLWKFEKAVLLNGNIYCIPFNYPFIIRIDINKKPGSKTAWTIVNNGLKSISGKLNSPCKFDDVSVNNNLIYCIPGVYDFIVQINTLTNKWAHLTKFDISPHKKQIMELPRPILKVVKNYNFMCSATVGKYIYCIPYDYNYILRIDTTKSPYDKNVFEKVGRPISGINKFIRAEVIDNKIYCIPDAYNHIVVIDTKRKPNDKKAWVSLKYNLGKLNKKFKASIVVGKLIYCIPASSLNVIKIDTTKLLNRNMVSIVDKKHNIWSSYPCFKSCILVNDIIFLIPGNSTYIYYIKNDKLFNIPLKNSTYHNSDNFIGAVNIDNSVYCIPRGFDSIIKLDLQRKKYE